METLYHIRRELLEIGSFSAIQITEFKRCGMLSDSDYVRAEFDHDWLPLPLWLRDFSGGPAGPRSRLKAGKVCAVVLIIAMLMFLAGIARAERETDSPRHLVAPKAPEASQVGSYTRNFALVLGLLATGVFFQQAILHSRK